MARGTVRANPIFDNPSPEYGTVQKRRGNPLTLLGVKELHGRLITLAEFAQRFYGHDGAEVFSFEGPEGLGVYSHGRRLGPIPPALEVLHIPDGFGLPGGEYVGTIQAVHHFGVIVADHVAAVLAARHALRLDGGAA